MHPHPFTGWTPESWATSHGTLGSDFQEGQLGDWGFGQGCNRLPAGSVVNRRPEVILFHRTQGFHFLLVCKAKLLFSASFLVFEFL